MPRRIKLLWLLVIALLVVAGVSFLLAWRLFSGATTSLAFAPAGEGEFLVVVAPFRREDGDAQPIGSTLADDLRQFPQPEPLYRVETLARAPDANAIPDIVETFKPRILVTGDYDGENVTTRVYFQPPDQLPPPPELVNGGTALIPSREPRMFTLYAPQGLSRPLHYLYAWTIGQSYFWNGRYADALPHLQEAKASLPKQAPLDRRREMDRFAANLNWHLGYIAGPAQGNWQAARELFQEALRLDPSDPAYAVGLAASYAYLGELEQADAVLRQALRQHPDSWQIHFALAEIAHQRGDSAAALANYDKAITLLSGSDNPSDQLALADVYFNRGYYRLTHEDPTGALEDFQQALTAGRNDIYVQGNIAWAAFLVGDYETALAASEAARTLEPDDPDLAFNEALLLLAAGDLDAARTAYEEAIDLTLKIDDVITRSTHFGKAYYDLADLAQRRPDLTPLVQEFQAMIDTANG